MRKAAAATTIIMMMTCAGMPKTRPSAMNWKASFLKTWRLPLVITCAMPRPAMKSTSVATIGWIE